MVSALRSTIILNKPCWSKGASADASLAIVTCASASISLSYASSCFRLSFKTSRSMPKSFGTEPLFLARNIILDAMASSLTVPFALLLFSVANRTSIHQLGNVGNADKKRDIGVLKCEIAESHQRLQHVGRFKNKVGYNFLYSQFPSFSDDFFQETDAGFWLRRE